MSRVLNLAQRIVDSLRPYSRRIEIVGSLRRREANPKDIDIVLIPKDVDKLVSFMEKIGEKVQSGRHESTWIIDKIKVELYYTVREEFGAALLAYSSEKGAGIGLRVVAKKKGLKLNNHGLFRGKKRIAGRSEKEIYAALGRPYKAPWNR